MPYFILKQSFLIFRTFKNPKHIITRSKPMSPPSYEPESECRFSLAYFICKAELTFYIRLPEESVDKAVSYRRPYP